MRNYSHIIRELQAASLEMRNPFKIEPPASISFSGGRSSAYMLYRIIEAHGGKLPAGIAVCFANTGKEDPATLDFVRDCGKEWGVHITWIEMVVRASKRSPNALRFKVVNHRRAARNGEPFQNYIAARRMLPSLIRRSCTQDLKVLPMKKYLKRRFPAGWTTALDIRADERARLARMRDKADAIFPMADASIRAADVVQFWQGNSFDLRLPHISGKAMRGNCDLCFLKGRQQLKVLIRENPKAADWWIKAEESVPKRLRDPKYQVAEHATFLLDTSYRQLREQALGEPIPTLNLDLRDGITDALQDCYCGD